MIHLNWTKGRLVAGPPERARVVDSYLLRDGHVVRWDLHEQRFAESVAGDVYPFLHAVRRAVPAEGEWFPRIEWYENNRCGLSIRPAPPRRTHSSLWFSDLTDPRKQPLVKGPDLEILGQLRICAHDYECDDTLLITKDGTIVEAANSAVVFWRDPMTVILPLQQALPSVTVRATIPLWHAAGISVIQQDIRRVDLPAWCGSALHGWTPVVSWGRGSGKIKAAPAPSVERWNEALWGSSKSV